MIWKLVSFGYRERKKEYGKIDADRISYFSILYFDL